MKMAGMVGQDEDVDFMGQLELLVINLYKTVFQASF